MYKKIGNLGPDTFYNGTKGKRVPQQTKGDSLLHTIATEDSTAVQVKEEGLRAITGLHLGNKGRNAGLEFSKHGGTNFYYNVMKKH